MEPNGLRTTVYHNHSTMIKIRMLNTEATPPDFASSSRNLSMATRNPEREMDSQCFTGTELRCGKMEKAAEMARADGNVS